LNYAGKFDATFPSEGPGTHSHAYAHVDSSQTHAPAGAVIVPDAQLLFHADFSRSGTDLILSKDHHEYVVHDYFTGEKRAPLASPDGAHLTADIVKALVGEVEVSQAGTAPVASQVIGHVTKLQGSATVIRNGVSIILNMGDNVEKGDVVESGASSTVGITFIDGTVFGLSSNARMVLNEMVYDPNGSNNSSLLSLVAGTITFVAGETAKHGDMKIDTPVATMGIRGTAVLVEIDFTVPGQSGQPNASFQVLVEPDGTTGSYILFDKNTLQPIAIVNQAGQQININNGIINITTNPLSPDLQKLITDVFQQKFTDNSTNTKSTSPATDSIIPTSSPLIIKTAEAIITAQTVTVPGSSTPPPPTTQSSSTFHVPGAPIIHIGNLLGVETTQFLASGELTGLTGSPLPDGAAGIVSFNDINVGDRPSVSSAFSSFTYKNAHGQDVTGGLSALQLADIAATEVKLTITPFANNTNIGSALFTYSIADQAFDFLAAGEQITLTYVVTINDNYAPAPDIVNIPITITITGTNDVPVITTSAQSIAFTPAGTKTVGGDLKTTNATSGKLAFTDVDLTDTHTVAAALTSAVMSNGGTVPPLPESVFEAALSAALGIDSTGTGAGTINWQLSALPVYLSDFIPPHQTLTLTYTITVTDSQGATSTQTVTVIITGNNDPAVVWIHTTTDGHDNLWTTANNWETGTVPTSSNDVIIITDQLHPNTPAYPVTIDGTTNAAANSVTMNDFVSLPPELDILQGGSLAIVDALSMSADSVLINAGTITVGGKLELLDSFDTNNNFTGLNTSVIVNSGTLSIAQGGDIMGDATGKDANGNAVPRVTNTGLIDLTGGTLNVAVNIANSVTDTNGKVVGGEITVEHGAKLVLGHDSNNKATVNGGINGGTLTIKGELDLLGSNFVKDGTLDNSGNVYVAGLGNAFDAEMITNSGAIELKSGAALVIDQGSSVSGSGTLTIDGNATLTLNDVTIGGNTINNYDVNGGGTIDVAGDSTINDGATLNNGTVNVDAKLTLDTMTVSGATINDNSDGSIELDHTVKLTGGATILGASNALGTITNKGTLEVSGTAALTDIALANTNGNVQVDGTKTLTLDGTTITGGTINDYSSTTDGTIDIAGDSTIDGNATLNNGAVNVDAKLTLDTMTVSGTTINDNSDGSIELDHTVKLTGGATIQGPSTATLGAITNLGTLEISGAVALTDVALANTNGTVQVDGTKTLTLDGTTITGGTINDYDSSGGGTIEVRGSSKIQGTPTQGVVTAATLSKGGVTVDANQTLTLDNVTVTGTAFTDTAAGATLALDGGTQLTLSGVTIHGGTINDGTNSSGATIDVTADSRIDSGATLNNGGVTIAQSVILTLDGVTVNGTSFVVDGVSRAPGELVLQDATTLIGSQITIDGNDELILDQATITGGSITNGDTIEVKGSSKIQGTIAQGVVTAATLSNGGVTVDAGQTLTLDNVTVTGVTFADTAAGATLALDGGTQLTLSGATIHGGTINDGTSSSGATIDVTGNSTIDSGASLNNGAVDIAQGVVLTLDDVTVTGTSFVVDSMLQSAPGELILQDGTNLTGSQITVDGNDELVLDQATLTGGSITNSGTIEVRGSSKIQGISTQGVVTAAALSNGGVTVDANQTLTLDNVTVTGTTFTDTATGATLALDGGTQLTLSGTTIHGGTINDGTSSSGATIDVTGNGTIDSNATLNNGTVNVDAKLKLDTMTVSGTTINDKSDGSIELDHTVKLTGGATIQGPSITTLGAITNNGTLEISGSAALTDIALTNGAGTVQVDDTDTLTLSGTTITGGTINDFSSTAGGTIDVAEDSTINGSATLNNGAVNVDAKLTLDTMTVSGTTIYDKSDGSIELDHTVKLTDGATIQGQSSTQLGAITNNGTLEVSGTATLLDDSLTNTGQKVLVDSGQTLNLDNSTVSGGSLNVDGEVDSTGNSFLTGVTIDSTGNIKVVSGTLTIDPEAFTNGGTVEVENGATLVVAGETIANSGTFQIDGTDATHFATLDLQASAINGGNIDVSGVLNSTGASIIDGATVTGTNAVVGGRPASTIEVTGSGSTLTLDDGATVTNGNLTIANGATLHIATGANPRAMTYYITGSDPALGYSVASNSEIAVDASGNVTSAVVQFVGQTTQYSLATGGSSAFQNLGNSPQLYQFVLHGSDNNAANVVISTTMLNLSNPQWADSLFPTQVYLYNPSLSQNYSYLNLTIYDLGATLDGVNVVNSGSIQVDGGTALELSGTTISGGTIDDYSTVAGNAVGGDIVVTGASTIDGNASLNGGIVTVDAKLTLATMTVSGTTIVDAGGGVELDNTVKLTGNAAIEGQSVARLGTITNNGTLEVVGPASLTDDTLTNNSIVQIDSGQTLTLSGTEIIGGTINDNSSVGIDVTGASKIDSGSTLNNGGVTVEGGVTLTLDGVTVDGTAITDKGTVVLADTVTLEGASIAGVSGSALGTITNNGKLEVAGTSSLTDDTLTNNSIIQIDNGQTLMLSGTEIIGGTINDNSSVGIDVTGASKIDTGATMNNGAVNVDAKLTLDAMTVSGTTINDNSNGSIELDHTVKLTGGATIQGSSNTLGAIANNGKLEVSGTAALINIALTNSAGIVQVDDTDTLTLNGATIAGGTINDYSSTAGGTVDVAGNSTINGSATLNNGTVNVDAKLKLDTMTVSGTTINDKSDGSIEFDNTVKLTGGATIQGQSSTVLGVITNLGLLEILGAATLLDVTVTNTNHNIQVDSGQILDFDNSTITSGTLTVTGEMDSTGTSFITGATIVNQNNIHVISGTLTIDPTPVTNNGTIEAMKGATLVIDGETITNGSGKILVDSGAKLDLQGAEIDGGNITIEGELDSSGNSLIHGANIINDGVIDITGGALTIDATSVLSGTGGIKMDGGSLALKGALVGNIDIGGAGTLELESNSLTAYSNATVTFDQGSTGTLKLDFAEDFGGHVAGFTTGQTLDLTDIAYSSKPIVVYTGTAAGGVLAVYVNGQDVANIDLTGNYLGVQWVLSSDGQHGTDITESTVGVLAATLDHSTAQQGVTMHVTGVTDGGTLVPTSNLAYAWQMSTDGKSWTTVGTGASFTPGEAQEGHFMQLVVTDTNAGTTQDVVYGLGMPNDLAVTVDQTTAQQGLPIDVTSVTDGGTPVSHGVTYLWETSTDGGQHWTAVGHSSSYTPSFSSDGGKLLQLVVSYTDPGESESVTDSFGTVALAKEWTGGSHSWETGSAWSTANHAGAPTSTDNAVVDANGHYTVTVDQSTAAAHSLVENASQATVEIAFGGKLTLGGNLVIDQGNFQVDLGGTLKDIASSATISGSFTNNGTVEAGGKLEIADTVSGFGSFKIDAGATLQLDHASSENVTFSGSGTLALEDPTHFSGIVSDSTGSLTNTDVLDLAGFDTKASVNYIGGTSLGVVVVSENGKVATIAVGANTTHWTKPVSDGHGGILIEDPVQNDAAPNANTSHAWSTAGADSFVFKSSPGANAALDADHSPVWPEPDHPDSAGKLAQFLQTHDAAGLPNLPSLLDTVTPDSLKTQLLSHHNEFHFV
jgi:hypothetical protein